jgi:hypothetical protein
MEKLLPKRSRWEMRAGDMYWQSKFRGRDEGACRHRVGVIADEMKHEELSAGICGLVHADYGKLTPPSFYQPTLKRV